MTTPLRKPHPTLVSFEFRGFEFEESSEINPPNPCSDIVVRQILPHFASETLLTVYGTN